MVNRFVGFWQLLLVEFCRKDTMLFRDSNSQQWAAAAAPTEQSWFT